MSKINFFTPLTFDKNTKTYLQSFQESVDNYFYLGGKQAHVFNKKAVLINGKAPSWLSTTAKIITYATVAIPALMLVAKGLLRCFNSYNLQEKVSLDHPLVVKTLDLKSVNVEIDLSKTDYSKKVKNKRLIPFTLDLEKGAKEVITQIKNKKKTTIQANINSLLKKDSNLVFYENEKFESGETFLQHILNALQSKGYIQSFTRSGINQFKVDVKQ